ncbi:predicted protein [Naegleria gruberi]|uniref:Predicted protein n=1 Tax=Naegleria gruberi TaxID=5762 RepID=D2V8S3_NAEGR|nr:uncharacterized protein NAEGRDRAFT_47579 [Naegleria gruberi]EFC46740.1 predicted protein [Naegleria gruberi]|eukprot:XP_002679484.1 predicted protein [Naegleria gruberi strain NEG-M]
MGDGSRCAFELVVEDKCDLIITLGGDGSTQNTLNGLVRGCLYLDPQALAKGAPLPVGLAVIPTGSGNDLQKTIGGEPVDVYSEAFFERTVKTIAESGKVVYADIGKVEYTKDNTGIILPALNDEHIPKQYLSNDSSKKLAYQFDSENTGVRFFMNESSFGISTSVLNAVNNSTISKEINYNVQTLWKQLTFVNPSIDVEVDGETVYSGISQLVCVGNGKAFGNGMYPNPNATITSENLSVCILHNIRLWNVFSVVYSLKAGTIGSYALASLLEGKKSLKAKRSESETQDVYLECDGEVVGKLPAQYDVVPAIIKMIVPESSPEYELHSKKNL